MMWIIIRAFATTTNSDIMPDGIYELFTIFYLLIRISSGKIEFEKKKPLQETTCS